MEDPSNKSIEVLLWNTEGIRNAIPYVPQNILKDIDAIILTETFLTEPLDLQGFYAIHSYATPTAGTPAVGITCFLKGTMGKIQGTSKEENMVIIKTTAVTLIPMYITPGTPIESIIETISKATEETEKSKM
jgi:hypothetical protein